MNIRSDEAYPANMLSNFAPHAFELDGIPCGSMEGFLQSLKYRGRKRQRKICALIGKTAKAAGAHKFLWKWTGYVHWQGRRIKRTSPDFAQLIARAYGELSKNPAFCAALLATGDEELTHDIGKKDPRKTILTEREFVSRLTEIRTLLRDRQS